MTTAHDPDLDAMDANELRESLREAWEEIREQRAALEQAHHVPSDSGEPRASAVKDAIDSLEHECRNTCRDADDGSGHWTFTEEPTCRLSCPFANQIRAALRSQAGATQALASAGAPRTVTAASYRPRREDTP
jgi:predicted phage gp36 major capsid-like protein